MTANDAMAVLQEFVEDVKLACGTGEGDEIDEELMDWPDLAATFKKALRVLQADQAAGRPAGVADSAGERSTASGT